MPFWSASRPESLVEKGCHGEPYFSSTKRDREWMLGHVLLSSFMAPYFGILIDLSPQGFSLFVWYGTMLQSSYGHCSSCLIIM